MLKDLKNKQGISLTTMVITVMIMLIIMGTLVYSAVDSVKIRKLNKLYNDLRQIGDAVEIYYLKNGTLPTNVSGDKIEISLNTDVSESDLLFLNEGKNKAVNKSDFFNPNDFVGDKAVYYKINLNLMDNLSINYPNNDYYINENSHTIYNYTGVTIDKKTYNKLPLKYTAIN